MKPFFTPEDFDGMTTITGAGCVIAAEIANAKLAKHLEGLPVVHGFQEAEYNTWFFATNGYTSNGTHTARLWGITPTEAEKSKDMMRILTDELVPPDEFHLVTAGGKRHIFKFAEPESSHPEKVETAEDLLAEILTAEGIKFTTEWHKRAKRFLGGFDDEGSWDEEAGEK